MSSLRPALLLSVLFLAACGKKPDNAVADAAAAAPTLPCALGGSLAFANDCTVERTVTGDGLILLLHHPDGGFRRLQVTTDGRGVVTADGADPAIVTVVDPATIEVAVGGDRYRLPATVRGQDLPGK